jgi:hypothetical protein
MIGEDATESTIAKNRAPEASNTFGRFHPTRCLRIELTELLQFAVFLLGQNLDSHLCSHVDGVIVRFGHLARLESFAVVADGRSPLRSLFGAIDENELSSHSILANHIGLSSGALHFIKGPKLSGVRLQPRLNLRPGHVRMPPHIRLKAHFQDLKKVATQLRRECLCGRGGHLEITPSRRPRRPSRQTRGFFPPSLFPGPPARSRLAQQRICGRLP